MSFFRIEIALTLCTLFLCSAAASEKKTLAKLAVYPPAVSLETERDFHEVVVTATFADETTADVTNLAQYSLPDPTIATLTGSTLTPVGAGTTEMKIRYGEKNIALPISVREAHTPRPASFRLDVMPVFLKGECNNGSCHGAARGQDRFMLSLFGYDPEGDYHRLTQEMSGRRINLAIPEESLLIEKALERVPHSGGKLFEADSDAYKTLVEWIRNGAPNDDKKTVAKVVSLTLYPPELVLEGEGTQQKMAVVARYSDGSDRDVTALTLFSTNNARTASVSDAGIVTSSERGEAFIMARFDAFTTGSHTIVIPKNLQYERAETPAHNYIDTLIYDKLHKLRIFPSALATDEVFLRRAYLDIIGKLPTIEERSAFLADSSSDRRTRLVQTLTDRPEFLDLWVMKFAELLQIRTSNIPADHLSYKGVTRYHGWLRQQFTDGVPMDEIVRTLLTSSGGTLKNPPTNFYQVERDTNKIAENVAQIFMGMRLQCAQCHNHPFDRWTMEDYYGWSSFFAQVGRKNAPDPREVIIYNRTNGEAIHPVTKKPEPATYLGGALAEVKGKDRRVVAAEWLTAPDNPYFARNLANILWAHYFGSGIIEPVDDVRISNPPSNPQLLDALAEKLVASRYDFRQLARDICLSRTYQLSTQAHPSNALDTRNFARASIRRQRAEILSDSIAQVTNAPRKFKGLPQGARAVEIADGNTQNYFLTTFGRSSRTTVCSCEVKMDPNLGQALHLINGEAIHANIGKGGVIKNLINAETPLLQILNSLYLRCYSREPTEAERTRLLQKITETTTKAEQQAYFEDVFWALLNSKEFLFNH